MDPLDWQRIEADWRPELGDSAWTIFSGLRSVFGDDWLSEQAELLAVSGCCHHLYRWLVVRPTGRPVRLLALATAVHTLSRAAEAGRLQNKIASLLQRLGTYSLRDPHAFFGAEFEAVSISRLLQRESPRLAVLDLEDSAPSNPLDIHLQVDGRDAFLELKTLQESVEETEANAAVMALTKAIHENVTLSKGCEVVLFGFPDDDDITDIANALMEMEDQEGQLRERELACGVVRYGKLESGIGVGFDLSPERAIRRIRNTFNKVVVKARQTSRPVLLAIRPHFFDNPDAQRRELLELLAQAPSNIVGISVLGEWVRHPGVLKTTHELMIRDNEEMPMELTEEQIWLVIGGIL